MKEEVPGKYLDWIVFKSNEINITSDFIFSKI